MKPQSRFALLVDDDPLPREITQEILEELGWTVTAASSAEEALAVADTAPTPLVLIVDINLGSGMDGFEFGGVARKRWPNIPIVYFSGRPLPERKTTFDPHEIFLMKPVPIITMERAIACVTGEAFSETARCGSSA